MKAMKLKVGFREWDKLLDFMYEFRRKPGVAVCDIDVTSAFIATEDAETAELVRERAGEWFTNYEITTIK